MPFVAKNCPHDDSHGDLSLERIESSHKCTECDNEGPNLWLCLYPDCNFVGCAEMHMDHSTIHNTKLPSHSAHMNLSTKRIWCYSCKKEVFVIQAPSPSTSLTQSFGNKYSGDASVSLFIEKFLNEDGSNHMVPKGDYYHDKSGDSQDSTDSEESRASVKPGLVGLQNIGSTCYMNAALQALSNVPPLTRFFLEFGRMVSYMAKDRKPGLSISYLNLVKDMWDRRASRGYVVPHGILTGIRTVHSMFRGYHQHDTQEFLRCFMDQLHEELKEQVEEEKECSLRLKGVGDHSSDEEEAEIDGTGSSQSDAEYETCDSGVSEQSSLSDEGERGMKRRYSKVSQGEKTRNKFVNRSVKKSPVEESYSQQQRTLQSSPVKHRTKKQIKTRSIISDVFDGKLLSSVQCLTCNRISTRVETFQDLSLPIPSRDHIDMIHQGSLTPQKAGPCSDVVYVTNQSGWFSWLVQLFRSWIWGPVVTLHNCLAAFFSTDELKGDNMYSCEKCNKLRNGIKFSKVLELPEILCIHLKRFRHELMFSSKIASYVSFPLEGLELRPFLHKECVSKVTTYDLISVICHHGTPGGGHYICYALNNDSNQWYEFDDQCVTQVSAETVKNSEAYVLFYKKMSPEMNQLRAKTAELMDMSSREPPDLNFFVSRQWINRFNTFSEPGPIDNSDFLCPHGGVSPVKKQFVNMISMQIPQNVWEFIYKTFGGGPACTQLYECPICEEKYEKLQKRRHYELETFHQVNLIDNHTAIYAISMAWLRQWQSFVKSNEAQPPGPIDNSSIIVNKGGQTVLKVGSDYSQISEELWQFFANTYGGGPELMLQCQRPVTAQSSISVHSSLSSNVDPSPKFTRMQNKGKQVTTAKSVETISQQDSAIESMTSDSDLHQTLKEVAG